MLNEAAPLPNLARLFRTGQHRRAAFPDFRPIEDRTIAARIVLRRRAGQQSRTTHDKANLPSLGRSVAAPLRKNSSCEIFATLGESFPPVILQIGFPAPLPLSYNRRSRRNDYALH